MTKKTAKVVITRSRRELVMMMKVLVVMGIIAIAMVSARDAATHETEESILESCLIIGKWKNDHNEIYCRVIRRNQQEVLPSPLDDILKENI